MKKMFIFFIVYLLLIIISNDESNAFMLMDNGLIATRYNVETMQDEIISYSETGTVIDHLAIPVFDSTGTEYARDLIFHDNNFISVYNGTFNPYLSTYDIKNNSWSNTTFPGWSSVNNLTYGGIAKSNNNIFLTDMQTFGDSEDPLMGIIRYDVNTKNYERILNDKEYTDVTTGENGNIYALRNHDELSVIDPVTFNEIANLHLPFGLDIRAVVADNDGFIYGVGNNGGLYKFDQSGNVVNSVLLPRAGDINIDGNFLYIGNLDDQIYTYDTSLNEVGIFKDSEKYSSRGLFVEHVNLSEHNPTVPEPTTLALLGGGLGAMMLRRRKKA